ncbi:transposase [Nocardia vinacea]|uniref:transposase n=1 Tax=Nocardia vinacea TaxID=96468 RepID=UPI003F4D0D80
MSTVMDLFGREIIGHTAGLSPNLTLTNASLDRALARLGPGQKPIVHSDQGFQYQHASWRALLRGRAVQSMSRKGNCLDNAVMESFFGHMKDELCCNNHIPDHGRVDHRDRRLHRLVQHRTGPLNTEGPEPGSIPGSGPSHVTPYDLTWPVQQTGTSSRRPGRLEIATTA